MKVQLLHKGLFVEVLVQPKFYLFHNLVGLQTCTLCISSTYKTPQLVTHEKVCWTNNSTVGEMQVDIWYHHCIRLATLLSQKDVDLDLCSSQVPFYETHSFDPYKLRLLTTTSISNQGFLKILHRMLPWLKWPLEPGLALHFTYLQSLESQDHTSGVISKLQSFIAVVWEFVWSADVWLF